MEITIKINDKAARAIAGIAHNAGTAEMYVNTLSRLFNAVLYNQDDLGMDDTEAITTLQALGLLRSDIEDIAGSGLRQFPFEPAITVEKVDFGPVDLTGDDDQGDATADPWGLLRAALREGADLLAQQPKDESVAGDIVELLEDMATLRDRLESLTEWKNANERYPEFAANNFGAEKLRAFLNVANSKAVSLMELANDITDSMWHADRDAAEIDKIREVAELATKAAKITKQALEREETHTADDQEGADK